MFLLEVTLGTKHRIQGITLIMREIQVRMLFSRGGKFNVLALRL